MFEEEKIRAIREFYETRDRWVEIKNYRSIRATVGEVRNIFYGDSITNAWPLHEFFPGRSILNRGLGGDNIYGLYDRLQEDVLAYRPKRVFLMIGINGIEEEQARILAHIQAVAGMMRKEGISVFSCSILPLRHPDNWNRFQYQDKIVQINAALRAWVEAGNADGFLDYHALVRDASGQLAAECATADGTHVTFEAYRRMSGLVRQHLL